MEAPLEELILNVNAQPITYVISVAIFRLLEHFELEAEIFVGHSLGEYAALTAVGSLSFSNGCSLLTERAHAMNCANQTGRGTMVAVTGLTFERLASLCNETSAKFTDTSNDPPAVVVACENSSYQIVIAGTQEAMDSLLPELRSEGAIDLKELPVDGAFHSPMMEPAVDIFKKALDEVELFPPSKKYLSSVSGLVEWETSTIRQNLMRQITSPVRWLQCTRCLLDNRYVTFVEVGPGRSLGTFVRHENAAVDVFRTCDVGSLANLLSRRDLEL